MTDVDPDINNKNPVLKHYKSSYDRVRTSQRNALVLLKQASIDGHSGANIPGDILVNTVAGTVAKLKSSSTDKNETNDGKATPQQTNIPSLPLNRVMSRSQMEDKNPKISSSMTDVPNGFSSQ